MARTLVAKGAFCYVLLCRSWTELCINKKLSIAIAKGNRSIELTDSICEFSVKLRHTPGPHIMQFLGPGKIRFKWISHYVNIHLMLIYSTSAYYSLSAKIRTKWIIGCTKWIFEYFSYLALVEYRTKWIRIKWGPGVYTFSFKGT